jgi:hypothetical protein
MKQAVTRKLFSYWNNLRAERAAPERADIDPAAIRALLRDTFILEVDPGRNLPVRVAGARVSALFNRELKGQSFVELYREDDRECLSAIVESVLDDPTPAVCGVSAAPIGREPLEMELLLLPLRHHGKTHARILGSLVPSGFASWMGLIEAQPLGITSLRIIRREALQVLANEPFSTPNVAVLPLPASRANGRPFALRVVEGGRAG